jgi:putative FmdB family regulatory protein
MPLFEYACKTCEHTFEWLTRGSSTPECPLCHGTSLEKRQSVFAARSSGPDSAGTQMPTGACGSCGDPRGPGSCSLN